MTYPATMSWRSEPDAPRSIRIVGIATFTMDASRTAMNWPVRIRARRTFMRRDRPGLALARVDCGAARRDDARRKDRPDDQDREDLDRSGDLGGVRPRLDPQRWRRISVAEYAAGLVRDGWRLSARGPRDAPGHPDPLRRRRRARA